MSRYQWLANLLLQDIRDGVYKPGDMLPTEHVLMQKFKLSSTTVRRSLRELESQGAIYRRAGKGTFVRRERLEENLIRLTSFAEEMRSKNLHATFQLLQAGAITPPPAAAQALHLVEGEEAYYIERLQLAENEVVALAAGYWQVEIGRCFAASDLHCQALYEILENRLNVSLDEADETIYAAAANPKVAPQLQVAVGHPLLVRQRTSYTTGMQPVEYTTTFYRADRYVYKVRLLRHSSG